MKSPDAMEHMTLKDNCVGHRMFLSDHQSPTTCLGNPQMKNYQMNQCRKNNCPMHNAIYNVVLCVGQSTNFDYLTKRALNENNIRLRLFLRHGATKTFNQNMPAKFSCV